MYSLGTVLYEMLAGEPPFTGPTAQAVIAKRLRGEVPPRAPRAPQRPGERGGGGQPGARARWPPTDSRAPPSSPGRCSRRPPRRRPRPLRRSAARRRPRPATGAGGGDGLGLGILIGLGVLFAWRRSHAGAGGTGGAKVLAVLPFENLGDSADAYFADGVANDLRTKLSQVRGSRRHRPEQLQRVPSEPRSQHSRSPGSWAWSTCSPPPSSGPSRRGARAGSG